MGSAVLKLDPTSIDEALWARQVRMHRANTLMLCSAVPLGALAVWWGVLVAALAARAGCGRAVLSAHDGATTDRAWMRRLRWSLLGHGMAWSATVLLPIAPLDGVHWAALSIVLVGVVSGSFSATAFDLASAMCFGVPVLGALAARLLTLGESADVVLGLAFVFTLAFLSVSTRRTQSIVRESEALRLAESAHALALRRSEALLERTGASAGVGGWELDAASGAVRLTAQAGWRRWRRRRCRP
jgi:hypothetical protein